MSTDLFSKMYRPSYLKDKEDKTFKQRLGISIKGMEKFNIPGKKVALRTIGLQLIEGLAACLMGYVEGTSLEGTPSFNMSVYARLNVNAYMDSHTADFTEVVNSVASGSANICGANFGEKKIFTEVPSTSTVTGSTNTGKTELSVFISSLMTAIFEYRSGNSDAAFFLDNYQKVLDQLTTLRALPLINVAGVQIVPADLAYNLKVVSDNAYEWLAYGGLTERAGAPANVTGWEVDKHANQLLPSYTQQNDFASMLTDADEFRQFMSTKQFPKEVSNSAQPSPQPTTTPSNNSANIPPNNQTTSGSAAQNNPNSTNPSSTNPRTSSRQAVATARSKKPARPDLSKYVLGIKDSARIRMPRGGSYSVLLKGPAGTGKTYAVFNSDKIPTNRVGVSSEVDASLLLGEFNRDGDGAWKPFLGSIAKVARTAMLEAILVQFHRGKKLVWKDFEKFNKHPLIKTLKILQSDPTDKEARLELDLLANPTVPSVWALIDDVYFAIGAPDVGPVRRLFLDEIWDSAGNKEVTTVLKFLMEDERRVILSRAGAGWTDLFGYNVHLVAAGNPDESMQSGIGLSRAMRSRFGFTYGVDYCKTDEEIKRTLEGAKTRQKSVTKPVGFELVESSYIPEEMPLHVPSEKVVKACVEFGDWTRTEFKSGGLAEMLDPRGVDQIAYTTAYLFEEFDMTIKEALLASVETVTDRLCEMDDLGLSLSTQVKSVTQKAAQLGDNL